MTLVLLAAVCGVQAATVKTNIDLSQLEVFYNYSENEIGIDATTFTLLGANTQIGIRGANYAVADYDRLVISYTFIDAKPWYCMARVDDDVADHYYGEWTDGENIGTKKTITIDLTNGLTANNLDNKEATDFSAIETIKKIYFFAMGDGKLQINEIYFEKEVVDEPVNPGEVEQMPLDWSEAKFVWGENDAVIDAENKTITKTTDAWTGNNAVAWFDYKATDISAYDRLVLTLAEASNGPVEVVISNGGFWGGNCHSETLAAGETELSINLHGLKITGTPGDNDTWATGDPLDLKNVNLIFIRTDNGTAQQVIKVDFFGFETDPEGTDETPVVKHFKGFTVADNNFNKANWDGDNNSFDTEANSFTVGKSFGSVAWNLSEEDFTQYDKLVFKGKVQGNNLELRLFDANGVECGVSNINHSDETQELSFNIADLKAKEEGKTLDLTRINQIVFWNYWDCNQGEEGEAVTVTIESLTLEAPSTVTVACNQDGKLGTICLPYDATIEGAVLYTVAGVDSKTAPKALYLEEAGTRLEAGVAYIYESTAAADIVCTLTSTVKADAATDGALVGTYSTVAAEAGTYVLSAGQWLKVVTGDEPTIGANRAWLNLEAADEVTPNAGVKVMGFLNSQTTAITQMVNGRSAQSDASHLKIWSNGKYFDLSGREMTGREMTTSSYRQLKNGLYIVNGKKMVK